MEHKSTKILELMIVLLLVTACSMSGGDASEENQATEEPTSSVEEIEPSEPTLQVTAVSSGICENIYYPVREGSMWFYKSTGGSFGEYEFSDTITSLRADGYTLTSEYDELTRTQEWACKPEGLVALQPGGGPAGTVNTSGVQLDIKTQNASGVTYPKDMTPGSTWQHTLDYSGTMDIAGETVEATGNATSSFTAVGIENITVPAGTFDAIKIQVETTINITSTFQGATVPVIVSGSSTSWFAEGVGWIKSVSTSDFGGTLGTETIELQAYNIP
jgi:hypothetical protein